MWSRGVHTRIYLWSWNYWKTFFCATFVKPEWSLTENSNWEVEKQTKGIGVRGNNSNNGNNATSSTKSPIAPKEMI